MYISHFKKSVTIMNALCNATLPTSHKVQYESLSMKVTATNFGDEAVIALYNAAA